MFDYWRVCTSTFCSNKTHTICGFLKMVNRWIPKTMDFNTEGLPSGKQQHNYRNIHHIFFAWENSQNVSGHGFNGYGRNFQRVYPIHNPSNHSKIPWNHCKVRLENLKSPSNYHDLGATQWLRNSPIPPWFQPKKNPSSSDPWDMPTIWAFQLYPNC